MKTIMSLTAYLCFGWGRLSPVGHSGESRNKKAEKIENKIDSGAQDVVVNPPKSPRKARQKDGI